MPALTFSPELLLAAQGRGRHRDGIAAAIFDVDGVLTDGRIYIGADGETVKAFSTLDGHGLKLLARGGIAPLIVTGRDSPAVRRRVAELGIVHAAYGAADKLAAADALLAATGVPWSRVAAIGDDWPDLPILRRAAFACAPPGAHAEVRAEVRAAAGHVTAAAAGHGAAREFCDLLLVACGRYARSSTRRRSRSTAAMAGPEPASMPAPADSVLESGAADSALEPLPPLDDDADLDLSFAGPEPVVPQAPWYARALDLGSAYLPLLMMGALAAATWWLVQTAPDAETPRAAAPAVHEPDYVMTTFTVQRFAADGTLKTQIEGKTLRHYPDDDTLEIDDAKIRAIGDNGEVTVATARRALANGDGSEVQLLGDAKIVRPASDAAREIVFRGEFFHAFRNVEQVRSHLPVTVTQGDSTMRADGMDYDHLSREIDLKGRVRAVFESRPKRAG